LIERDLAVAGMTITIHRSGAVSIAEPLGVGGDVISSFPWSLL
jgi:hypothetical protein